MDPQDLYWQTAQQACTAKQFEVLELRERHGFSLRQIAYALDRDMGTVRVHLDAAHRNIHRALVELAKRETEAAQERMRAPQTPTGVEGDV